MEPKVSVTFDTGMEEEMDGEIVEEWRFQRE